MKCHSEHSELICHSGLAISITETFCLTFCKEGMQAWLSAAHHRALKQAFDGSRASDSKLLCLPPIDNSHIRPLDRVLDEPLARCMLLQDEKLDGIPVEPTDTARAILFQLADVSGPQTTEFILIRLVVFDIRSIPIGSNSVQDFAGTDGSCFRGDVQIALVVDAAPRCVRQQHVIV